MEFFMWDKIKEWYKNNKSYLTMLLIGSAVVGLSVTFLALFFPPVLAAFASISIFGMAPLAFLTSLHLPLAVLTLGCIVTGAAFGAILGGLVAWKQSISIAKHVYSYFGHKQEHHVEINEEDTYRYLMGHLEGEASESFEVEVDEEFNDYTSTDSAEDRPNPLNFSTDSNHQALDGGYEMTELRI
ncbi:TPA: lpg2885 family Dot/Icm T4SS effector [Legionella pneumophila]|nr:lpg2885 family Dot/Icm T4SS effector [Legionella pneumophila]HAT7862412.1 lpg2885 family Dot/Icm T4SS effector [Legionella pneumophila]